VKVQEKNYGSVSTFIFGTSSSKKVRSKSCIYL